MAGEAKQRGTRDQRVAEAVERNATEQAQLEQAYARRKAEAEERRRQEEGAMTPEQLAEHRKAREAARRASLYLSSIMGVAAATAYLRGGK